MTTTALSVRHDPAHHRFVHEIDDGDEAVVDYRMRDEETIDLRRTYVPEEHRHQGIAGELVRQVLDHAREEGWRVIPTCPFVESWLDEHPDYADLRV